MRSLSNLVNIIKSLKCSNVSSTNSLDHNVSLQKTISPLLTQILVALGPLILTVNFGMVSGYSAILLPQLQSNNSSTIEINTDEASWLASLAVLPMALGAILGGYSSEKIGRKSTHIVASFPLAAGWLLIYFASGIKLILIGRFLTGLCCGILATCTGVYIGETSEPRYRGFLLGGLSFAISLGLLLSHLLGTFLHWQTTALICSLLPLVSLVTLSLVPESPFWLAKTGKMDKAKVSLHWCKGYSDEVERELQIMFQQQENEDSTIGFKEVFTNMKQSVFLKPLVIVVVYLVANQWVGVNAVTFYTISIMRNSVGYDINEYLAMLIIDLIRVIMSVIACVLLKTCLRRPLAMISGIGTTISLFAIGAFNYFSKVYIEVNNYSYVPLIGLISYISFISIGFVPLPWALVGELFPLKSRSIGSGITSFMAFIAFFSVVKTSPSMFESLGTSGTFFVYCLVAFLSSIFIYFFVPETKGKHLHEIESYFRKNSNEKCNAIQQEIISKA